MVDRVASMDIYDVDMYDAGNVGKVSMWTLHHQALTVQQWLRLPCCLRHS
jgi:hypothetical protein